MKNLVAISYVFLSGKSTKSNQPNKQTNKQIMISSAPLLSETHIAILNVKAFILAFERNSEVSHEDIDAHCLAAESVLNLRSRQC